MKRLTIFTPTYNRAYILPKLYESLCAQTCQDFEWLIVDDGSTDNTRLLVDDWNDENVICIRYFYQDNSGKMMAHNKAVCESQGELFMCVDSDDHLCTERVVEDSLNYWHNEILKLNNPESVCGFVGYKKIGEKEQYFPKGFHVAHLSELMASGFVGELTMVFRHDVLAKHSFPYFEGEKFVTDVYIYDQIDRKFKFLFFDYYMQNCEYQIGGYSHNYMKLLFDNPQGYRAYKEQCVRFRKKGYLKDIICYEALTLRIGDWKLVHRGTNVLLVLTLLPLGVLKYFYDSYRLLRIKR